MATAYINIGSNIGDRQAFLGRAVAAIQERLHAEAEVSDVVESEPWGYESQAPYLNVGLKITTTLAPERLLETLLTIEKEIDPAPHRDSQGRYIDRAIDIDLIAVDELVVSTSTLTLPHPRMHLRLFVLAPLAQLAPDWRHPLLGVTAQALYHTLLIKGK
ncbi:MAG: 2-amino-4-hydroxy-6-hydroxymethyldihydropteridine diphosphokinase [Bacteroidales bacterium]|nr:2-amino-4-hydroxy-6-hydroxymethyldihydropteridine diphosphokinase [Bacteroidales bacterium]